MLQWLKCLYQAVLSLGISILHVNNRGPARIQSSDGSTLCNAGSTAGELALNLFTGQGHETRCAHVAKAPSRHGKALG